MDTSPFIIRTDVRDERGACNVKEIDREILELFMQLTADEKQKALNYGKELIERDEHQQGDQE